MASPPFSLLITSPANTDIAANFPTLDRSDKDVIQSWLLTQMNSQGHDLYTLIDRVGSTNGPGSAPTPAANTAAIYYDSTKVLLEYRGDTATAIQLSVPVGAILDFAGAAAPNGYALCGGQAISRTTFATLFALIGSTYGSGDGSTTFNVPDMRGRTGFGKDNMGGSTAGRISVAGGTFDGTGLGNTGGLQNSPISQAMLPNVNFTVSGTISPNTTFNVSGSGTGGNTAAAAPGQVGTSYTGITSSSATFSLSAASGGSGAVHPNLSPAIILNKIIRTL